MARHRLVLAAALVVALSLSIANGQPAMRLEAEDAQGVGVTRSTTRPAYSGTGYVWGFHEPGDKLTFSVQAPAGGMYDLAIRYATPGGRKGYYLDVNGAKFEGMFLRTADAFVTHPAGRVELKQGENTITMEKYWGHHDIDYIELSPTPASADRPPVKPPKTLCDPAATPAARALHGLLVDQFGVTTLSGVQDTPDGEYTREVVGDFPAIAGGDLIEYSPSRVERGADAKGEVERLIRHHRDGSIVTLSWHWNAPRDLLDRMDTDAQGKPVDHQWYRGFYTEATTFDVEKALADEKSEAYGLLLRDIDAIAVQLRKFADADVPVLWRPLHEAEGGWFWWGAKGNEPFIRLWRLVHDRLTDHHNLHNVIWVYTSAGDPTWYPGDAYVDVVGVDCYPPATNDPLSSLWETLYVQHAGRKLLAVSEFGGVPDVARMHRYGARWGYFVSWTGQLGPKKMSKEELRAIYANPAVVTQQSLRRLATTAPATQPAATQPTRAAQASP
jgi:mannan endo-1,4-beta-mannosidase